MSFETASERFPETVATQPELLGHHYGEAGLTAQAIPYWHQAGQRAVERSANIEAIAHFTKGLESLNTLPDTPERTRQELALQIALGVPLVMTKGYAAPKVERAYVRARELCQQMGETPQLFPVLWGLWVFYFVQGKLQTGNELGEQLLHLAQRTQDPALLLEAHLALGAVLLRRGELTSAREHLEQGIALYDRQQHRSHAFLHGQDPQVACLSDAAYALWLLGYPDQARKSNQAALILAQELAHPFSLAFALTFTSWLQQFCREERAAQEWADATVTLSTDQGFPNWLAIGSVLRGWALTEQGQREEGIVQTHQGLTILRATGAELTLPYCLALLAEAYGKGGRVEEGLTILTEALAVVHKNEERWWEAELYRLKGTLTLQSQVQGPRSKVEEEAEGYFLKALEITHRQSAKSLELRAVMSLSRLWLRQGKKAEARWMLADIYSWFTEGFDTKDLQEAKALLQELT